MPRVLYVEDDNDAAAALAEHLRARGFEPILARSAEQAMEMLADLPPDNSIDLMITDLSLPGIDGAELCRILRSKAEHRELPIILLTGVKQRLGIEITEADRTWLPADKILDKSVHLDEVLSVVKELLGRK